MKEYKLAVVGDRAVGKFSLAFRFTHGHFVNQCNPFEAEPFRRQCMIDTQISLLDVEVPSTAGQEVYALLTDEHIQSKEGFLLVYSTTSRSSFQAIQHLQQQILRGKPLSVPVILIGTKCDLEEQREVTTNVGHDLARELGCPFMETSSKEGNNIDEAFCDLVRLIRKRHPEVSETRGITSS
ncbi:ras-like protein [Cyathus striatus]|nr:ras-like protein [Cyathus striatus]